eukprot:2204971-Rhodomonas_salina.1
MHCQGQCWTGGNSYHWHSQGCLRWQCLQQQAGATAITVGGICTIPNVSSGTMLDRGQQLSPLGVLHGYHSPATSF